MLEGQVVKDLHFRLIRGTLGQAAMDSAASLGFERFAHFGAPLKYLTA